MKTTNASRSAPALAPVYREYFERIARPALPYFRDRPVAFVMAPYGPEHELLFERTPGVRLQSVADLRRCATLAVAEIHARNARADRPRYPDWLVLRLEAPSGALPASLRHVAEGAEDFLREVNLRYLWKHSGERALDLLLPLRRSYETVVVLDFAKMMAELVCERMPFAATLRPEADWNRVRIDYHRNQSHRTILAPFSPLAIVEPTVSLPVARARLAKPVRLDVSREQLAEAGELMAAALRAPNDLEQAFVAMEHMARKVG